MYPVYYLWKTFDTPLLLPEDKQLQCISTPANTDIRSPDIVDATLHTSDVALPICRDRYTVSTAGMTSRDHTKLFIEPSENKINTCLIKKKSGKCLKRH